MGLAAVGAAVTYASGYVLDAYTASQITEQGLLGASMVGAGIAYATGRKLVNSVTGSITDRVSDDIDGFTPVQDENGVIRPSSVVESAEALEAKLNEYAIENYVHDGESTSPTMVADMIMLLRESLREHYGQEPLEVLDTAREAVLSGGIPHVLGKIGLSAEGAKFVGEVLAA